MRGGEPFVERRLHKTGYFTNETRIVTESLKPATEVVSRDTVIDIAPETLVPEELKLVLEVLPRDTVHDWFKAAPGKGKIRGVYLAYFRAHKEDVV